MAGCTGAFAGWTGAFAGWAGAAAGWPKVVMQWKKNTSKIEREKRVCFVIFEVILLGSFEMQEWCLHLQKCLICVGGERGLLLWLEDTAIR